MKFSLSLATTPASNTFVDFLDANISNDWKGSIFFWSDATAVDTQTAAGKLYIGATDGTRNGSIILSVQDATAGGRANTYLTNAACLSRMISSSSSVNLLGAFTSAQPTGVRVTLSANDATLHQVNSLNFAGSDVEFALSFWTFNGTDTSISGNHNLTGAPDCMMLLAANGLGTFVTVGEARATIGLFDGTNGAGVGFNETSLANPSTIAARLTADLGHSIVALADHATWGVNTIGATTLNLTRTAAGGDSATAILISWRATSGTPTKLASTVTARLTTGDQAVLAGMTGTPALAIAIPTRLLANTLTTDDTAGSLGFCVAVNNNGVTQNASSIMVSKNAAATTVAKSYTSNTKFLNIADTSVALVGQATLKTWDTGGYTVTWTSVPGSATYMATLAYGVPAPVGGGTSGKMLLTGVG